MTQHAKRSEQFSYSTLIFRSATTLKMILYLYPDIRFPANDKNKRTSFLSSNIQAHPSFLMQGTTQRLSWNSQPRPPEIPFLHTSEMFLTRSRRQSKQRRASKIRQQNNAMHSKRSRFQRNQRQCKRRNNLDTDIPRVSCFSFIICLGLSCVLNYQLMKCVINRLRK